MDVKAIQSAIFNKKNLLWLIGVLLIGCFGSGLWDMIAKPSLNAIAQGFLSLVTFGSEAAKDSAYQMAATDPTAMPSMMLMTILTAIPLALMLGFSVSSLVTLASIRSKRPRRKEPDLPKGNELVPPRSVEQAKLLELERLEGELTQAKGDIMQGLRNLKRSAFQMAIVVVLLSGAMLVQNLIYGQAVLIWRTFHADLAICAPFLTSQEEKQFLARYAGMKRHKEFEAIHADLEAIAKKNNLELRGTSLW